MKQVCSVNSKEHKSIICFTSKVSNNLFTHLLKFMIFIVVIHKDGYQIVFTKVLISCSKSSENQIVTKLIIAVYFFLNAFTQDNYLSTSSSVRASVLCSPVARASSSFSVWTSLFNLCIISLGSSSSLTMTSFLIIATLCAKRQVDIDSWKRVRKILIFLHSTS